VDSNVGIGPHRRVGRRAVSGGCTATGASAFWAACPGADLSARWQTIFSADSGFDGIEGVTRVDPLDRQGVTGLLV
jgi:hypothetical protein